jgi:ATP-dependent DNA helicase UvrD/PcrA
MDNMLPNKIDNTPAYLDNLNAKQCEAIETIDGPVLVLAGAGTGKTRVLTTRLAHILYSGKARPQEMLSVTFTNKAAREMRDRVAAIIGEVAHSMWLGTFHSIGMRILRRHTEEIDLKPNFTILDSDDQLRLIKQILKAEEISDKVFAPKNVLSTIQSWKDRGLIPDKVTANNDTRAGRIAKIYELYQERLKALNAVDFGDLLLHCLTLFQKHPDILGHYQDHFKYIMVDEYQDTNVAQYLLLRLLAQKHKNICCVGDDDQSIYSWRGAEIQNILNFEKDFPSAKTVRLEQNYRSTSHILGAASALIDHNSGRLGKTLWTDEGDGEKVIVRGVWDGQEEARAIASTIESLKNNGEQLSSMAILVRAGFQTREFEERFITIGVPYRVIGGLRFYERLEIRDAMAYLRVLHSPDDSLAFERIVNTPKRGVGPAALQTIHNLARARNISLYKATEMLIESDELRPSLRKNLTGLLRNFEKWRDDLKAIDHPRVAEIVLDESGYTEMWQNDKTPEAPGRLENLKEFIHALEEFQTLGSFLEHVSLVMDNQEDRGKDEVSIMTLHSAKGLEFDTVFLPGWEEDVFPHQLALEDRGESGLEEERRLAYVGLTRAKKRAAISYAANRRIHNKWQSSIPSRFVHELPDAHITRMTKRGISTNQSYGTRPYYGYSKPINVTAQETYTIETSYQPSPFKLGARVHHSKFGFGTILEIEGDHLAIQFESKGLKRVIASFVNLAD